MPTTLPLDPLACLLPEDRAALTRSCARFGVRVHFWRRVASLRVRVWVDAIETLADQLQGEDAPREPALQEACDLLGVKLDTHRQNLKRARRQAYDPSRDERDRLSLPSPPAA